MQDKELLNHLALLQGYYKFLYLGKFMEELMKKKDLSKQASDTIIPTGDKTSFVLQGSMIKQILADIHKHADKKNIFGYMVEINSLRGIINVMRELLESNETFQGFVKNKLQKQYFPFEQIIKFVRNIMTHTLDSNMTIKKEDFIHQKTYLLSHDVQNIHFIFTYAEYFPTLTTDKKYGVDIKINFKNLKQGQALFHVIDLHQLYLLCELCYNLSEIFRAEKK